FAEARLQPAVLLAVGIERLRRVVDRLEDSKLGLQLLDDGDRRALELQLCDPAAQIVDLEHVLVHAFSVCNKPQCTSELVAIIGAIRMAMMLTTLIIGLIAGPAVSLFGSPTVSPVTAAACVSVPLPPKCPSSMYFLALSQAPPPEVIWIARKLPVTIDPMSMPPSAFAPRVKP